MSGGGPKGEKWKQGTKEKGEKNCRRAVQIFVKVDGMKTVLKEVSSEEKVR